MLKKVCCGVVIPTISLLLTPCLSVVGMAWLLLLLVNIIEIFRSGFCEKKILPLIFSWCVWGAKWIGLSCSMQISFVCSLDLTVSAIWFLNFFPICHLFAEVKPFLSTLILLDIGNSWHSPTIQLSMVCDSSTALSQ